jgi:hypothetical protein
MMHRQRKKDINMRSVLVSTSSSSSSSVPKGGMSLELVNNYTISRIQEIWVFNRGERHDRRYSPPVEEGQVLTYQQMMAFSRDLNDCNYNRKPTVHKK